jgi:uncharacterized protein DUF6916
VLACVALSTQPWIKHLGC